MGSNWFAYLECGGRGGFAAGGELQEKREDTQPTNRVSAPASLPAALVG